MPNWCENKLQIFCDCIQAKQIIPKLFRKTESDKWCLDFELLVPMPESICIESSSLGDRAMEFLKISPNRRLTRPLLKKYIYGSEIDRIYAKAKHHRWDVGHFINWLIKRPEQQSILWLNLALGQQYLSNLAQHGYKDWYDWSNEQWAVNGMYVQIAVKLALMIMDLLIAYLIRHGDHLMVGSKHFVLPFLTLSLYFHFLSRECGLRANISQILMAHTAIFT